MREYELPPGVRPGGPDIGDDPAGAEVRGLEMLRAVGTEMTAEVRRALPEWAQREVARLVDAWGRHGPDERSAILDRARAAGEAAAQRVAGELSELFATDPDEQGSTPLQIVRSAHQEVGAVLRAAGVPAVERDEFARRSFPDDDFGIIPDTFDDLGVGELGSLHLAWGVAKATVHNARRAQR